MAKPTASPVRTGLVHLALIIYTLIALFPVFLTVINSFKDRSSIFRDPLGLPTPSTFSLIGYQTVLGQGDFVLYFQNSFIVTPTTSLNTASVHQKHPPANTATCSAMTRSFCWSGNRSPQLAL